MKKIFLGFLVVYRVGVKKRVISLKETILFGNHNIFK